MAERTEQNGVEQAQRGEPAAVAELYRRYWRAARAAAYGVTGNLSLAEDAASEAFWAAMNGLARLRDPERFGPWLRTIEELLRRLSEQVIPGAPVQFRSYEEPRYRAALRMQLGDEPAAAALGGVLRPWSVLPEGVWVASVTIHLEPWASIRSGQPLGLTEGTPFPSFGRRGSGPA